MIGPLFDGWPDEPSRPPTATAESWKTCPPPVKRASFRLDVVYPPDVAERIRRGHVPREMEDKWFIYCAEEEVRLLRSWTGFHIFGVEIIWSDQGAHLGQAWVSRNREEYLSTDVKADRQLLLNLLSGYFVHSSEG